jgi:hypothetical protein
MPSFHAAQLVSQRGWPGAKFVGFFLRCYRNPKGEKVTRDQDNRSSSGLCPNGKK